jgi:hypothetical protein
LPLFDVDPSSLAIVIPQPLSLPDAPNPWKTHTYTDDHSSVSWLFRKTQISSQNLDQWKREKKNNYYIYRIRIHPDTIWTGKKHSTHRETETEREWKTEREKSRNK